MLNLSSLSFSRKFFCRCFCLLFSDSSTVYCDNFVIKKLLFHPDIEQIPIYKNVFRSLNTKYFIMKSINEDMNYGWAFTHHPLGRPNVLLGALDLHCKNEDQYLIKTPYVFHSVFSNFVFIEQHNLPCLFHYKIPILDVVNDNNNLKDSINIGKELQHCLKTSELIMSKKELSFPLKYNSKKDLFERFDVWSSSLLNAGVIFFGITINMLWEDENGRMAIPVYDKITAKTYISRFLNSLYDIDFIDCSFGSVEIGKAGIPHIHCVLGFRIAENIMPFIRQKIESRLYDCYMSDYKISYLSKFIDVTRSLRYLSKDFNKERPLKICFFCVYSYVHVDIARVFGDFLDGTISYLSDKTDIVYFGDDFHKESLQHVPFGCHSELSCLPSSLQKDKNAEILYYLILFFSLRGLSIFKGSFYQKIEGSLNSYKYLGSSEIIKVNFINYMNDLKENTFDFIDPLALSLKFCNNSDKIIESLSINCGFSKKTLNLEILEFKDGLYLAYNDTFICRSNKVEINSLTNKFFFTRYYSYYYKT